MGWLEGEGPVGAAAGAAIGARVGDVVEEFGRSVLRNYSGRSGRQQRLRDLGKDDKIGRADRGWIKQENNSIDRGQRNSIRNPPGKQLAHERGREAAKGYDYNNSNLQGTDLHKLQHSHDNFGRLNKERPMVGE
ncbi:polymorphic toxin type 8 domain-containing protein [Methylopila sp. M107]|uniref:polymorphic toxin type 8 domain-containing protein n=1 Tax=Methylopila sp. M107 TaxID=1101190 RepID=UPI0018CBBD1E|nr:polymorphic toxin type 8 domain-containing protein [Methylopila sp. M107]